jgi:hypothetical protein
VRAGIVPAARLTEFRYSSYWYLGRPKARPAFLDLRAALAEAGGLTDTPAGRRCYADFLAWQATDGPAGRNAAYVSLSRGWALGTAGFKTELIRDHQLTASARAWEDSGAREMREQEWEARLADALGRARKTAADARRDRKSAGWKVAIAVALKRTTQVTNGWLAERLNMGSGVAVSQYVGRARRAAGLP